MRLQFKHLSMIAASVVLIGCGGGGGSTSANNSANDNTSNSPSTGGTATSSSKTITISKDNQIESLGKEKNTHVRVNIGDTPKSLYILLSNYSKTKSASSTITHDAKIVPTSENKKFLSAPALVDQPKILHTPAHIQAFNSNIKTLLQKSSNSDYQAKSIAVASKSNKSVGDSETFYMDAESTGATTTATLKKVVSNISTELGSKTLNVWVENDSFGNGCKKVKCVTQDMVDTLADTFLQNGTDNDIYDWVTNVYGEEWGETKYNQLITANDEITILLTDIGNDNNPSGGTIGYFWSKDNVTQSSISGSNQRVMFYADAVMFSNTDNDGFWQKEMYSTLAHEFQHMIHFYQKTVLLVGGNSNDEEDTWINEMLSETTEDLIATKIEHTGPRGVVNTNGSAGEPNNKQGRYPDFNEKNTLSLTAWSNSIADYAKVNAFGTFLTRNYGGAQVLHDIVHNSLLHEDSIMDAVHKTLQGAGKTFDDLIKEWGIAVMLSDNNNLQDKPTYNTGDFTEDTYNNSTYQLGSINFFNYDPQPTIQTTAGTVQPQGNYYYKIGDNLTGTVSIDLSLNGTTEATLIAK
jgi:hypothetical protein